MSRYLYRCVECGSTAEEDFLRFMYPLCGCTDDPCHEMVRDYRAERTAFLRSSCRDVPS